jgi:predicted transcriptional regulator
MVNRDRHDITLELLRKTAKGKKKTEIMRDIGLSYTQTKQYLAQLMEKGLLEADDKRHYKITKKGAEFLEKCQDCPLFRWDSQKKT